MFFYIFVICLHVSTYTVNKDVDIMLSPMLSGVEDIIRYSKARALVR